MRNAVLIIGFALGLSGCGAAADDVPKAEIFGGYSLLRADIHGMKFNTNGWNAAVTGNLNRYFGVTADMGGQYGTVAESGVSMTVHGHSFLFGPTVSYRTNKLKPFAHVLFGVSHGSFVNIGPATISENSFALDAGGGLDIKVARHVSIRPVQLDWRSTSFFNSAQDNLRYAAGIVLNFGGH